MKLIPVISGAVLAAGLAVLAAVVWTHGPDGLASDQQPPPNDVRGHAASHAHDHAGHSHDHAHAGNTEALVALHTEPEVLRPGERSQLTFTLSDASGKPVGQLMTHHARKLHVVIIAEDMQALGHVHPQDFDEPIGEGKASVFFSFPRAGRYLVAADFMTANGSHAAQFTVDVAGPAGRADETGGATLSPGIRHVGLEGDDRYTRPILLQGEEAAAEYAVSLHKPPTIRAGEETTLVYRFTRDGAPVNDLRPYLDAPMHLAVVKDDLTRFLHEHGTVSGAGHMDHHSHAPHEDPAANAFGPEVTVTLNFPEPGTYSLFGQAVRGDTLIVSRHPVEVR